MLGMLNVILCM